MVMQSGEGLLDWIGVSQTKSGTAPEPFLCNQLLNLKLPEFNPTYLPQKLVIYLIFLIYCQANLYSS
jgi:hypothetical protein